MRICPICERVGTDEVCDLHDPVTNTLTPLEWAEMGQDMSYFNLPCGCEYDSHARMIYCEDHYAAILDMT